MLTDETKITLIEAALAFAAYNSGRRGDFLRWVPISKISKADVVDFFERVEVDLMDTDCDNGVFISFDRPPVITS